MKKLLISAMAGVVAAGSLAAVATSAEAQPYRYRHHRDNNDAAAAAVVGGVLGLALGAAIAGSNKDRRYYDNGYYNNGYYNGYYNNGYYGRSGYDRGYYGRSYYGRPAYAYGYSYGPPRMCVTRDRVYDPYIGRRVTVQRSYPC
ncbi:MULTISPECIES: hypothetical protein [Phenylobacterium]|uniref:Lectin-like protein BA14k n=1 Tax=Phenylobacterium koreense TaxID=266125 RepID=A0ABV2EEF0_9CAUL